MRFDFQYRTSENELRSGSLSASSRDAAFRALKARGINPSRVVLSPGVLNRLSSIGKRGWAIVILIMTLAIVLAFARLQDGSVSIREVTSVSDIDPEVLKRIESSGMNVDSVNELLEARRRVNEEYRRKIETDVASGKLTRSAADELYRVMGLFPANAKK